MTAAWSDNLKSKASAVIPDSWQADACRTLSFTGTRGGEHASCSEVQAGATPIGQELCQLKGEGRG